MSESYTPRIVTDVTEELHKRFQDLVPWGLRGHLLTVLIEDVLDLIEQEGDIVTALIIKRKLHARNVLKGGIKDVSD